MGRFYRSFKGAAPVSLVIVGAGPAGLMAAEAAARQGARVHVYDSMPSPGRKFLLAGKGGLNLTHSEPLDRFIVRYGAAAPFMAPLLREFGPAEIRDWAAGLGIETFIGSSGRVFPAEMKAAPLLRAWLRRLRGLGVTLHARRRWLGWAEDGALRFALPDGGEERVAGQACILALGGASWPNLGSDGGWVSLPAEKGIAVTPLRPANCGFDVDWSPHFAERWAGGRTGTVGLSFGGIALRGEVTLTAAGIEGGAIYALSAALRDEIAARGEAVPHLDLMPDWPSERVVAALSRPRGAKSLSTFLKKALPLSPAALALLREITGPDMPQAAAIKALPLRLRRPRPLAEAISTAGGIALNELDEALMLKRLPGTFVAGEMADWDAPTGGYLLTGCLAMGHWAGRRAADFCNRR